MRSLHSWDKSPMVIRGLILDYNFARPCEALNGKTPAELAMAWKPLDGKRGWLELLQLAEQHAKGRGIPRKKKEIGNIQKQTTFDLFLLGKTAAKNGCCPTFDHKQQRRLDLFLI